MRKYIISSLVTLALLFTWAAYSTSGNVHSIVYKEAGSFSANIRGDDAKLIGEVKTVILTVDVEGLSAAATTTLRVTRIGNVVTLSVLDFGAKTLDVGGGTVNITNSVPLWAQPSATVFKWEHYQMTQNGDSLEHWENVTALSNDIIFYSTDRSNGKPSTTFDLLSDKTFVYTVD